MGHARGRDGSYLRGTTRLLKSPAAKIAIARAGVGRLLGTSTDTPAPHVRGTETRVRCCVSMASGPHLSARKHSGEGAKMGCSEGNGEWAGSVAASPFRLEFFPYFPFYFEFLFPFI